MVLGARWGLRASPKRILIVSLSCLVVGLGLAGAPLVSWAVFVAIPTLAARVKVRLVTVCVGVAFVCVVSGLGSVIRAHVNRGPLRWKSLKRISRVAAIAAVFASVVCLTSEPAFALLSLMLFIPACFLALFVTLEGRAAACDDQVPPSDPEADA